jgi:uncharacterized protein
VAGRASVAATRAARAVGLLNRDGLDPGEGLWIVPSRGVHTFWMRFTIDVLALDDHGVVIDRVPNLKPWRVRLPRRGTAGVLELPAGTPRAFGHRTGPPDRVRVGAATRAGDAGPTAAAARRRRSRTTSRS